MKILQALLFVCISLSAFSQKNYVDGFIILKNQTDTLKGKIDDLNWAVNPASINFKNVQNIEESYSISQLKAFGIFEKESYIVEKADLDITPFESTALLQDRNLIVKKDTLLPFLVLLKADYSLLYLKDETSKEHFFYKDHQKITELINHKFLQKRGEKVYEFNNKLYQKQLELLFNQCSRKIQVNNTEFEIQALTDKFIEFSECIGCTYTCYVKKKADKAVLTIGLMAGISSERNFFSHNDYYERNYFEAKTKVPSLLYGLNFSISSRRNLNRNILLIEAFINQECIKNETNNYSATFTYLNFVPLVRHQFISHAIMKPFVGAGVNFKYMVSRMEDKSYMGNKINLFLIGEGGVKLNNFLIAARIKVKPMHKNEDVKIVYTKVAEVLDVISYQRVNFQLQLTYLLYNSAKKKR
ncbi:hypothetical protein [Emticicia sp. 21SJ11W-3]|uniref:hypothetical protein n=1 Tax=Emticicia sp. 21SJ11W-3 TaxID=2916755 RepID=UPI00209D7A5D|nr:hypothetical protein [Emticicia sp. 21SJ11W-3]UTA67733.1 hypothetical protein MB380_19355 [Emticicia sp. 21SJ11W-3]